MSSFTRWTQKSRSYGKRWKLTIARKRSPRFTMPCMKTCESLARNLSCSCEQWNCLHKHRRRDPHHQRQIPPLPQSCPNNRTLRKGWLHNFALRLMEETNDEAQIQGQGGIPRLRLSPAKRLRHVGLRVHSHLQERKLTQVPSQRR